MWAWICEKQKHLHFKKWPTIWIQHSGSLENEFKKLIRRKIVYLSMPPVQEEVDICLLYTVESSYTHKKANIDTNTHTEFSVWSRRRRVRDRIDEGEISRECNKQPRTPTRNSLTGYVWHFTTSDNRNKNLQQYSQPKPISTFATIRFWPFFLYRRRQ